MSKQHPQFVIEGKLLWSSELIIRVSSLCQRYVKETLSIIDRRYLAKLNTSPDTFSLLCLMETPLSDILADDSCLDNPAHLYKLLYKTFSVISFKAREKEFFCKGSFAIQTVKNSRASLSTIFLFAEKSILETIFALLPCCHLEKQKNSQSQAERLERKGK